MGDSDTFFWSMIFSAIGAGYFIYGKNQRNMVMVGLGALLCLFPYFISSLVLMLVLGGVLTLAPFFLNKG